MTLLNCTISSFAFCLIFDNLTIQQQPLWTCFSLNTLSLSQLEVLSCSNEVWESCFKKSFSIQNYEIIDKPQRPFLVSQLIYLKFCNSAAKFLQVWLGYTLSLECQPSILSSFQKPVQRALTQHCPQIFLNQHFIHFCGPTYNP